MSKFLGKKTNNAKNTSKAELRKSVFNKIDNSNVLEVFCGSGEMYRNVWCGAKMYTGIDIKKFNDERHTIQGDSIKVLMDMDLSEYNVFDIDAYGSPYYELKIILSKIDKEAHNCFAFVITDGIEIDLRMGNIEKGIRSLLGLSQKKLKNAHKIHDMLILKVVEKLKQTLPHHTDTSILFTTGNKGSGMRYYSVLLKKALQ